MIHLRSFCSGFYLFIRSIKSSVTYVIHYAATVKPRILKHHSEFRSKIVTVKITYIMPVNQYSSVKDIMESHKKFNHRGFSGSCRSDYGNFHSGFNISREVLYDNFIAVLIAEFNMIKGYVALYTCILYRD